MTWLARTVVVLLTVISTSGVASAAQAFVERVSPGCCGDDEQDSPVQGEGCPPTCFACTRAMSPAPAVAAVRLAPPLAQPIAAIPHEVDLEPSDPPRPGVFHPPRSS